MDAKPLPHRDRFEVRGTYLNSAYTHPMSKASADAMAAYIDARMVNGLADGYNMMDDRNQAKALFARLINCDADELCWVPSTMVGENLIATGLDLVGRRAHVVTDAAHFEGSLYMYEQLRRAGVEVTVLPLQDNGIDLEQLEQAIRPDTRLVALSLVSALNGFQHDLKAVCALAHAKGALVFADIIQAAGTVAIDVRDSGVDFCACSTYKWLMGDFGVGFLYVRRDRLEQLRQSQYGYRQLTRFGSNFLPFEPPAAEPFSFEHGAGAGARFEVGTLGNAAVAALRVSLTYLLDTGVQAIQAHRAPMMARLQDALPGAGFIPLTRRDSAGPIAAFAWRDAMALQPRLRDAGINIQLYAHRLRVSPSVFNSMDDIEKLIDVLTHH